MIYVMPGPGSECKIRGPERAAIGWVAAVVYAWSRHTARGEIINGTTVWGLTRKSCQRKAARAIARFHAQEGRPLRPWTKEECEEILKGVMVGGLPPTKP